MPNIYGVTDGKHKVYIYTACLLWEECPPSNPPENQGERGTWSSRVRKGRSKRIMAGSRICSLVAGIVLAFAVYVSAQESLCQLFGFTPLQCAICGTNRDAPIACIAYNATVSPFSYPILPPPPEKAPF